MESEKKEEKKCCSNHQKNPGSFFIPSGVLMGLGLGILFNNVAAGLFLGLGAGFVAFTISLFAKKNCCK